MDKNDTLESSSHSSEDEASSDGSDEEKDEVVSRFVCQHVPHVTETNVSTVKCLALCL